MDCADVCAATVPITRRQTECDFNITKPLLEAYVVTCKSCGDECERHAQMHEHCRIYAEACRRCQQTCRELLGRHEMGRAAIAAAGAICIRQSHFAANGGRNYRCLIVASVQG